MSTGGLPTSDLMSIKGLAGMRGREPAVDTEAELPGLRGATSADKGMSSESLLEESEVSESSIFAVLDDKGLSEANAANDAFAEARIDARRAAAFGVRALVEAEALIRTAVTLSGCRSCALSDCDHLGGSGR